MGRRKIIEAGTELLSGYSKKTAPRASRVTKLVENKGISKRLKELDIPKANSTFHINTSNADNVSQLTAKRVNREARQAELERTFKQEFLYDRNKIITTDAKNNPILDKNAFKNERNRMLKEYDEAYEKMASNGTIPYINGEEGRSIATKNDFRIMQNQEESYRTLNDKLMQREEDSALRAATTEQKQLEAIQKYGASKNSKTREQMKAAQTNTKAAQANTEAAREQIANSKTANAEKAAVEGDKTIFGLTGKQILGTAVGGGLIFSMFNRGGKMSNSELYGQSSPYGY